VVGSNVIKPVLESQSDLGVGCQESRVEVQTHGGTVGVVMTCEIVIKEIVELISSGFA